jgi:hypothetical protein
MAGVLALAAADVGVWAQFAPRSFYDSFRSPGITGCPGWDRITNTCGADRTAWPIAERTPYDELAELGVMSALGKRLRRWQPIAIHGAMLAGARPEAVAGALGNSLDAADRRGLGRSPLDPVRSLSRRAEEHTEALLDARDRAHRGSGG